MTVPFRFSAVACLLAVTSSICIAAPPAAPTGFSGISLVPQEFDFTWMDNSNDETEFEFYISEDSGATWFSIGTVPADTVERRIGTFPLLSLTGVRLVAVNADGESAPSEEVFITAVNAALSLSEECLKIAEGDPVNVTSTVQNLTAPVYTAEGLPAGVSIDATSGVISGAPTERGYFQVSVFATANDHQRKASLGINVLDPPAVTAPIASSDLNAEVGDTRIFVFANIFEDPDVESTVLVETNLGDIPLTLFDAATPITAQNFKNYMNDGDWDGSFIHRAIPDFIVQAGGYLPDGSGNFMSVPDDAAIQNEYDDSRPNACGTLAMAKVGGNPDSATSEWFINLSDNAQNLDYQNEGFTTFGRVLGDGLDVFEAIAALTQGTYVITLDGNVRTFSDWPLTATSANSPEESELVILSRVASVAPMTFSVSNNTAPSIASTTILPGGTAFTLNFHAPGTADITISATDLDRLQTDYTFTAVSNITFSEWAAAAGVGSETDNPDGAVLNNLQEFAFGGDPTDPNDDASQSPIYSIVSDTMGVFSAGMSFSVRQFAPELSYKIQSTTDLITWTDVWQTSDGFAAPAVVGTTPNGDFLDVVVHTGQDISTTDRVFLRTVVEITP